MANQSLQTNAVPVIEKSRCAWRIKDMTGQRFGKLFVTGRAEDRYGPSGKKVLMWQCNCDCGKQSVVRGRSLRSGASRSCGCGVIEANRKPKSEGHPQFKHGLTGTREYDSWNNARKRTTNPQNPKYPSYGGRGIVMCDRWLNDFLAFLSDMGPRPEGTTLDRKDNNGPYSPENCRWANSVQQVRNRRVTVMITIDGETKSLGEWSEIYNIHWKLVWGRFKQHGWDPLRALTEPVRDWAAIRQKRESES